MPSIIQHVQHLIYTCSVHVANERCIANVRSPNFRLDTVSYIRRLPAPHTQFFGLSAAPMAISDEAESPGQLPLEPAIKHTSGPLFHDYNSI